MFFKIPSCIQVCILNKNPDPEGHWIRIWQFSMFLKKKKPPQIVGICGRVELVLFLGMIVLMEVASHRLSLTRLLTTGLLSLLGRGEILFFFCQPDKNALLWIQTYYILIRIWILGLCHQSLKKKKKWIIRKKHFFKKIFFLTKENTVMAPEEILVGWVSCTWSVV